MIDLTDLQRKTLEVVSTHPPEYPITGKDIAARIGLKPRSSGKEGADMRSIIHALRVKGYPVCAHGKGYFYAQNGDELKAFIDSLEGRAREVQEAADGLKQGYALVGQAKAQEEVKKATRVAYRAKKDGVPTVFSISEANVPDFLAKYPNAEKI